MKRRFSVLLFCMVLINALLTGGNAIVVTCATEELEISQLESISPYVEILEDLNDEFGTNFAFPTNEVLENCGMDRDAVIADILSTELEDYEQLIRSQYNNVNENLSGGAGTMSAATQKAYYDSSNYLSITANTYYADGLMRYSTFVSYSYGYSTAPFYKPFVCDRSLTSNSTGYNCVFTCYKMLNASVSYDGWTEYSLFALFTAGGGNTTASVL